ncbi:unnamed protein product [Bubo scandiacus]
MLLEIGGLEFPAAPFNGWYMSSEIGTRNLCDSQRYNLLPEVALRMGLDTRTTSSLWKDKAAVEVNIAVLHSYQVAKVTIVDHHAATESFVKHMENELRTRGGCPADWVWIVPPISGSLTPVFHQEMVNYQLCPTFRYSPTPGRSTSPKAPPSPGERPSRKWPSSAVKISAKLMGHMMARRVKATILYATETGKSRTYAWNLCQLFRRAFDPKVLCMDEYDVVSLEHETLVLVVTSTFGNGDPRVCGGVPGWGVGKGPPCSHPALTLPPCPTQELQAAVQQRLAVGPARRLLEEEAAATEQHRQRRHAGCPAVLGVRAGLAGVPTLLRLRPGGGILPHVGPPRLPGRLRDLLCGRRGGGGEELFAPPRAGSARGTAWSGSPRPRRPWPDCPSCTSAGCSPARCFRWRTCRARSPAGPPCWCGWTRGAGGGCGTSPGTTSACSPQTGPSWSGGYWGAWRIPRPPNSPSWWRAWRGTPVAGVPLPAPGCRRAVCPLHPGPGAHFLLGCGGTTEPPVPAAPGHAGPGASPPPAPAGAQPGCPSGCRPPCCSPSCRCSSRATTPSAPRPAPALGRSTSPWPLSPTTARMGRVPYTTASAPPGWRGCKPGDTVPAFIRGAPSFRLPPTPEVPCVLVGPGTGVAPFRSFWQHRLHHLRDGGAPLGSMVLVFGCRSSALDHIYRREMQEAQEQGALSQVLTAFSREPGTPKTYVQDVLRTQLAAEVHRVLCQSAGHMYVCGDVTMATEVLQTVQHILVQQAGMTLGQAGDFISELRDKNRYHEDIFGLTFRTQEVAFRIRSQSFSMQERRQPGPAP